MKFLVAKEPSLSWRMLSPGARGRESFSPFNCQSSYYLFWARAAIYHGLRALALKPGDNVLVPAYHCAAAVEPVLQYGVGAKFYNIHRDCSPDLADLQAKIDQKTRALLTIHYFGFPQPIHELQDLCRRHQLSLIEDCAHVLTGEVDGAQLGTFGDVSVFSWRKFFPVYDGGQLVVNNSQLSVDIKWEPTTYLYQLKVVKNTYERLPESGSQRFIEGIAKLLRRSVPQGSVATNGQRANLLSLDSFSLDFDPALVNVPMSHLSQYILCNTDVPAIVRQRRANYAQLLAETSDVPEVVPLFSELPEKICPWVFPLFIKGQQNFHTVLREKGIPAVTWGGVVHQSLPLAEFPDAAYLYQQLVFLPIHQGLGESEVRTMARIIKEALQDGV